MHSPSTSTPRTQQDQAGLELLIGDVARLIEAYEKQAHRLAQACSENEQLRHRIAELKTELDELNQAAEERMAMDSTPIQLSHYHQSDPPSFGREEVQMLLSEIDTCIALLEA
jgi:DNA repair exonuclease SbcCD ATPase subunit